MTRRPFHLVVLADSVLLLTALAGWRLGDGPWQAPAARPPAPGALRAVTLGREAAAADGASPVLERPLFAPDRRPPAVAEAAAWRAGRAPRRRGLEVRWVAPN